MSYNCDYCSTITDEKNYCSECETYLFWCDDCEHMTDYGEQRLCIYCANAQCDYHYEKSRSLPWTTSCCNGCVCDGCVDFITVISDDITVNDILDDITVNDILDDIKKIYCKKCPQNSQNS